MAQVKLQMRGRVGRRSHSLGIGFQPEAIVHLGATTAAHLAHHRQGPQRHDVISPCQPGGTYGIGGQFRHGDLRIKRLMDNPKR